jgi:hypothetical protein
VVAGGLEGTWEAPKGSRGPWGRLRRRSGSYRSVSLEVQTGKGKDASVGSPHSKIEHLMRNAIENSMQNATKTSLTQPLRLRKPYAYATSFAYISLSLT